MVVSEVTGGGCGAAALPPPSPGPPGTSGSAQAGETADPPLLLLGILDEL